MPHDPPGDHGVFARSWDETVSRPLTENAVSGTRMSHREWRIGSPGRPEISRETRGTTLASRIRDAVVHAGWPPRARARRGGRARARREPALGAAPRGTDGTLAGRTTRPEQWSGPIPATRERARAWCDRDATRSSKRHTHRQKTHDDQLVAPANPRTTLDPCRRAAASHVDRSGRGRAH